MHPRKYETRNAAGGGIRLEPLVVRMPEATHMSEFSRTKIDRRAGRREIILLKSGSYTLVEAKLRAALAALPRAVIRASKAAT